MVIKSTSRRGGRGAGRGSGGDDRRGGRNINMQGRGRGRAKNISNTRNDTEVDRLREENETLNSRVEALLKEKNEQLNKVKELSKNKKSININISTEDDLLYAGLIYAGFDEQRQRVRNKLNIERFKAFYQLPPLTLFIYFKDVIEKFKGVSYKDLLMTFNWFAGYDRLEVLAGRWGYCEKHIGARTQECAKMMQSLKGSKIKFEFDDDGRILLSGLDFVNFTTTENRLDPHCKW